MAAVVVVAVVVKSDDDDNEMSFCFLMPGKVEVCCRPMAFALPSIAILGGMIQPSAIVLLPAAPNGQIIPDLVHS